MFERKIVHIWFPNVHGDTEEGEREQLGDIDRIEKIIGRELGISVHVELANCEEAKHERAKHEQVDGDSLGDKVR